MKIYLEHMKTNDKLHGKRLVIVDSGIRIRENMWWTTRYRTRHFHIHFVLVKEKLTPLLEWLKPKVVNFQNDFYMSKNSSKNCCQKFEFCFCFISAVKQQMYFFLKLPTKYHYILAKKVFSASFKNNKTHRLHPWGIQQPILKLQILNLYHKTCCFIFCLIGFKRILSQRGETFVTRFFAIN